MRKDFKDDVIFLLFILCLMCITASIGFYQRSENIKCTKTNELKDTK